MRADFMSQSYKTVLNEVKDRKVILEPSYRKKINGCLGQSIVFAFFCLSYFTKHSILQLHHVVASRNVILYC